MGEVILNAIEICKSFSNGGDRLDVLNKFSLSVKKGEIITIVGQSGSGKSTALNILGTLDKPDSGIIEIGGVNVDSLNENAISRLRNRDLGFVFQFHHLLPEFTALENAKETQTEMSRLRAQSANQEAVTMIGKTVELIAGEDGEVVVGSVSKVLIDSDGPKLVVNGAPYSVDKVIAVRNSGSSHTGE